MEQLGIIMIRIGMKNYCRKFQDGIASKDGSPHEREKGQGYISDGKMEQYESPAALLRLLRRCKLRYDRVCYRY